MSCGISEYGKDCHATVSGTTALCAERERENVSVECGTNSSVPYEPSLEGSDVKRRRQKSKLYGISSTRHTVHSLHTVLLCEYEVEIREARGRIRSSREMAEPEY